MAGDDRPGRLQKSGSRSGVSTWDLSVAVPEERIVPFRAMDAAAREAGADRHRGQSRSGRSRGSCPASSGFRVSGLGWRSSSAPSIDRFQSCGWSIGRWRAQCAKAVLAWTYYLQRDMPAIRAPAARSPLAPRPTASRATRP